MHGLSLIRPLTRTERQNLERLHKGCEARGCPKQPECAITLEGRVTCLSLSTPASNMPSPGPATPEMRRRRAPIVQFEQHE